MRALLALFNEVAKAIAAILVMLFGIVVSVVVVSVMSIIWSISPLMGYAMLAIVLIMVKLLFY